MTMRSPIVADPIETFLPGCEGRERELRERLLKGRDYAAVRRCLVQSNCADIVLSMIISTAPGYALASMPLDELEDVLNLCLRLSMCADAFERLEAARG